MTEKQCGMIANDSTLHQRPHDVEVSIYLLKYGFRLKQNTYRKDRIDRY